MAKITETKRTAGVRVHERRRGVADTQFCPFVDDKRDSQPLTQLAKVEPSASSDEASFFQLSLSNSHSLSIFDRKQLQVQGKPFLVLMIIFHTPSNNNNRQPPSPLGEWVRAYVHHAKNISRHTSVIIRPNRRPRMLLLLLHTRWIFHSGDSCYDNTTGSGHERPFSHCFDFFERRCVVACCCCCYGLSVSLGSRKKDPGKYGVLLYHGTRPYRWFQGTPCRLSASGTVSPLPVPPVSATPINHGSRGNAFCQVTIFGILLSKWRFRPKTSLLQSPRTVEEALWEPLVTARQQQMRTIVHMDAFKSQVLKRFIEKVTFCITWRSSCVLILTDGRASIWIHASGPSSRVTCGG
jgi:hypothetical protein